MGAPQLVAVLLLTTCCRVVDLFEAAYCVLPELFHLFDIIKGCGIPLSQAFDGFLKDGWY